MNKSPTQQEKEALPVGVWYCFISDTENERVYLETKEAPLGYSYYCTYNRSEDMYYFYDLAENWQDLI